MFRNRVIEVISAQTRTIIPVPNDVIVCDLCNSEITTPSVMLLYLSKRDKHPYGTICENCRVRSFPKAEIVG